MTHADPLLPELSVFVARMGDALSSSLLEKQQFLSGDFVVPCATERLEKLSEGTFM